MAKFFLLETSDHSSRQPAVAVPTAGFRSGVTARHPAQELSIVNNEVGVRELMRIEQERCNAERKDREPEVDEVRRPKGHGRVEQQQEVTHTHVDTRACKSGVQDGER